MEMRTVLVPAADVIGSVALPLHPAGWRKESVKFLTIFLNRHPEFTEMIPNARLNLKADFTWFQELFSTTRPPPDLTRHLHAYYSVIEEILEGFVELFPAARSWCALHSLLQM
jgi:hypothetical protein